DFDVDLCDQWACGINHAQMTSLRLFSNFGRHAVRAEYGDSAIRHFVKTLNEHRAFRRELLHHESIVDDLFPYVYRPPQSLKRDSDDIDSANNARTKSPRLWEQNRFLPVSHRNTSDKLNQIVACEEACPAFLC